MKNQGYKELYIKITGERMVYSEAHGHKVLRSEISNEVIPYHEIEPWNFAHLCNKNTFSDLKHSRSNIVVMTKAEHTLFDDHRDKARQDERFDWVFILQETLKRRSHQSFNQRKLS